jgi:5'-nucleotidase
MDSIVVNLEKDWFGRYNKDYNDDLTIERVTEWHTHKFTKPECGVKLYDYLREEGLYRNLEPLAGAVEALRRIHDLKYVSGKPAYNIFYLSAGTTSPQIPKEKQEWSNVHTPFIDSKHMISCFHKFLVRGDIFIDDSPINIRKYRKHNPETAIFTIDYPYNRDAQCEADVVAKDFKDTAKAWDQMEKCLESIARVPLVKSGAEVEDAVW